eukprot:TRINITY_DN348_c0_g1_i4.p1 TRINITY_DN348_c0_g1~~TRINITY_DN348_c0_g1_i4.p1  ORF type:complete len:383 (-),score=69.10 TRINITY_DN348_c0_g1_i4:138-1286(-)
MAILGIRFYIIVAHCTWSWASLRVQRTVPSNTTVLKRTGARREPGTDPSNTTVSNTTSSRKSEVALAREKLEKMSAGLSAILGKNSSVLSQSPVSASIQAFKAQLDKTLRDTVNVTNETEALVELHTAQSAVKLLVRDMTSQQVRLMRENTQQLESLLLGVLMTRQHEPMLKQLEVLESSEFSRLPVVAAVLALKKNSTPLFKQVADYLDSKSEMKPQVNASKQPDLTKIVSSLEARIQNMEKTDKRRIALHDDEMKEMDVAVEKKKKNAQLSLRLKHMKKGSDRSFKKQEALVHHDIESLKAAVEAIKRGDVKTLMKAQEALEATQRKMRSHGNDFIVFIQTAHKLNGLDCPYCAAQCIEKCNSAGRSYSECLGECADAGQ